MSGFEHDHAPHFEEEEEEPHPESHSHSHGSYSHSHDGHSHSHVHEDDAATMMENLYEHHGEDDEEEKGPAERYVVPRDAIEEVEDEACEEVRYTGTSGLKVTVLDGLARLKNLRVLVLRACLVADCSPIAANGATLEHLELYDNQLKSLRGVEACPRLRVLDVSFNVVRSCAPVAVCADLEECYVAANKLRAIDGVEFLLKLRKLDLGANRIRRVRGLPPNLEHLFLGKNRIERIEHIDHLTRLRVLDVQSNRLASLGVFSLLDGDDGVAAADQQRQQAFAAPAHASLQELYLAHNAIGPDLAPAHLAPLTGLTTLDLSHNRLTSLAPFAVLHALEDLWLSYNQIPDLAALLQIAHLPLVSCIYLEHNPCAADPNYVAHLRQLFPNLTQLDALCYPSRAAADS